MHVSKRTHIHTYPQMAAIYNPLNPALVMAPTNHYVRTVDCLACSLRPDGTAKDPSGDTAVPVRYPRIGNLVRLGEPIIFSQPLVALQTNCQIGNRHRQNVEGGSRYIFLGSEQAYVQRLVGIQKKNHQKIIGDMYIK